METSTIIWILIALLLLIAIIFAINFYTNDNPPIVNDTNFTNSSQDYMINIDNFNYTPVALTVSRGDRVTWINNDSISHTVTSDDQVFESGLLDKGEEFSYTFNETGTFTYFCIPHPFMRARVIVI